MEGVLIRHSSRAAGKCIQFTWTYLLSMLLLAYGGLFFLYHIEQFVAFKQAETYQYARSLALFIGVFLTVLFPYLLYKNYVSAKQNRVSCIYQRMQSVRDLLEQYGDICLQNMRAIDLSARPPGSKLSLEVIDMQGITDLLHCRSGESSWIIMLGMDVGRKFYPTISETLQSIHQNIESAQALARYAVSKKVAIEGNRLKELYKIVYMMCAKMASFLDYILEGYQGGKTAPHFILRKKGGKEKLEAMAQSHKKKYVERLLLAKDVFPFDPDALLQAMAQPDVFPPFIGEWLIVPLEEGYLSQWNGIPFSRDFAEQIKAHYVQMQTSALSAAAAEKRNQTSV